MRIGVIFPQNEIGADAGAVRAYATRVDELGFTHALAYDHVVGADPAVHQGWSGPYDVEATFHEPMVLFGYLAALTSLELVTGVIILPQRQTALVAKQAAAVDLLCGGRFRLGVGVGWNPVEYDALGKNFADRGRRIDDQIELMRRLWTEPTVTSEHDDARTVVEEAARDAGRDPATIGMEGRVNADAGVDTLVHQIGRWRDAGASHLSINTMRCGFASVDDHLHALAAAAEALELATR